MVPAPSAAADKGMVPVPSAAADMGMVPVPSANIFAFHPIDAKKQYPVQLLRQ